MIINTRDDIDALPAENKRAFLRSLWLSSIDSDGVRRENTFGYTIAELDQEFGGAPPITVKTAEQLAADFALKKQQARTEINRIRDVRIYAGVEYPPESGVMFDSDELAQKNINGAVTMSILATAASQPFEQPWIAKNNTVITLDAAGVAGLGVTLGKHVGKHRLEANTYKTQLDAATDMESVQAVVGNYMALS